MLHNILKTLVVLVPLAFVAGTLQVHAGMLPVPGPTPQYEAPRGTILGEREMLLTNRYDNEFVNKVFADNVLLTLSYLSGDVKNATDISWDEVRKPRVREFVLQPGEVFAYHDGVMSKYAENVTVITNAHFNAQDGFLSSGYLYGDGVCHLASLFNWAANDAGLNVVAPANHDFRLIPDIPREYGTSIYYAPENSHVSEQQNLYIENTLDKPVTFRIEVKTDRVVVSVETK